jgi:hypothetical protein
LGDAVTAMRLAIDGNDSFHARKSASHPERLAQKSIVFAAGSTIRTDEEEI